MLWNGIFEFYTGAYMFLSFIGWISLDDLRFGLEYTDTERFSSLLGIILFVFSLTFPFIVCGVMIFNYKPKIPILDILTLEQMVLTGTYDKFLS
jgi:hypothetical protein